MVFQMYLFQAPQTSGGLIFLNVILQWNYFYLDRKWQSIFFESIKIKYKLLSSFCQRGKIPIAIHIDRFSFQNLWDQRNILIRFVSSIPILNN